MADKPSDPDLKPFPKEGRPVVFMFQPTHYKVVSPDKLQEWERKLVEKVGLEGFKRDDSIKTAIIATDSNTGGPGYDDCDMMK
jgi:hypothetical protein